MFKLLFNWLVFCFLLINLQVIAQDKPLIVAHRGGANLAPENTMAAFQLALSLSCDYIELDVHLTQDSQFVVLHDARLKRTARRRGNVQNMIAQDIIKHDVGSVFHPAFKEQKIPLLDSVLTFVQGRVKLLIEIKPQKANPVLVVKKLLDILVKYNATAYCTILSFDSQILKQVHVQAPELSTIKLITARFPIMGWVIDTRLRMKHWKKTIQGCSGVGWYYKTLSRKRIQKLQDRSLTVFVWTVNEENRIRKFRKWGVNGIITNDPELTKVILSN